MNFAGIFNWYRGLSLYPRKLNKVIIPCITLLIFDNILTYKLSYSILNNIFLPCECTLMVLEFTMGLLNIVAFTSWYVQIQLILSYGICPASSQVAQWNNYISPVSPSTSSYKLFLHKMNFRLSIFWLSSTDIFIRIMCIIGIINGAIICLLPFYSYSLIIISFCYLFNAITYYSFIGVAGDFLCLQNDSEMVELNYLMFVSSFIRFRYPFIIIFTFRWLAFRIMLACGLCKWFGSYSWKTLTAMIRHYITQPLPNIISWHLHNLQIYQHKIAVIMTFLIELPLPFMVFGASWSRYCAFIGFQWLIIIINMTGNFGYIGQLMFSETMSLLDDSIFPTFMINISEHIKLNSTYTNVHWYWFEYITIPIFVTIIILYIIGTWYPLIQTSRRYQLPITRDIIEISKKFRKYSFGNKYAKFGSMNEMRYEFIIQGFDYDSNKWKTYDFQYKPSKVSDRPPVVMLHLPRLDWRIWFLPLYWERTRNYYDVPNWLIKLVNLLKNNNEGILKLIKHNPFPIKQPRQVRVIVKKFEFVNDPTSVNWFEDRLMTNNLFQTM